MSGAKAAEPAMQMAAADVQYARLPGTSSKLGPTAVGQKAAQLRADFEKLKNQPPASCSQQLEVTRNQAVSTVNSYHSSVGAICARLRMSSTPGNPELLAEWSRPSRLPPRCGLRVQVHDQDGPACGTRGDGDHGQHPGSTHIRKLITI